MHPNDPENNGKKFEVMQNITVKNFLLKLVGLDCIFSCYKSWKKFNLKKWMSKKKLKKERDKRIEEKPDSLADIPSTDSSDSDIGDSFKGLSSASKYLGEGATLYLQTMKTLFILFLILTIINIPVYVIYNNATMNNKYKKMDQLFKYFTIGNLA